MIERLFKNKKTTILGLSIMAVCFALVGLEKASLTEVSAFIAGGFYILFKKDSNV